MVPIPEPNGRTFSTSLKGLGTITGCLLQSVALSMPLTSSPNRALVWFRRDLRLHDHHALSAALKAYDEVVCVFVFDRAILDRLPTRHDRRVEFIWQAIGSMHDALQKHGSALVVAHAHASQAIVDLASAFKVNAVVCNHDDEPDAITRDAQVAAALVAQGCSFQSFKDHVIFERTEVLTAMGQPFSVFTPYKNAWLKRLLPSDFQAHPVSLEGKCTTRYKLEESLKAQPALRSWIGPPANLQDIGFELTNLGDLAMGVGSAGARELLHDFVKRMGRYGEARDYPALRGPSYLSVHLRFGTLSIRELVQQALEVQSSAPNDSEGARVWLSELIWRDFYHQILHHHPRVVHNAFKPAYDRIQWDDDSERFRAWCEARTGYPLVDAAMEQINRTGYMHNRLRMVVASFLTKDLGVDWRKGEAYFAQHLNDFDLAANNGGWQWAASSGCDAQPYFRIFNPITQSEKFDPKGQFIRRYLPQLAGLSDKAIHAPWLASPIELKAAGIQIGEHYPAPIVDHAQARVRTLQRYTVVKSEV
jgi:deoxyribodipyrimidine photo-lyase